MTALYISVFLELYILISFLIYMGICVISIKENGDIDWRYGSLYIFAWPVVFPVAFILWGMRRFHLWFMSYLRRKL